MNLSAFKSSDGTQHFRLSGFGQTTPLDAGVVGEWKTSFIEAARKHWKNVCNAPALYLSGSMSASWRPRHPTSRQDWLRMNEWRNEWMNEWMTQLLKYRNKLPCQRRKWSWQTFSASTQWKKPLLNWVSTLDAWCIEVCTPFLFLNCRL